MGDPSLVRRIDRGRSPSLRTADRVLAFMAAYDRDSPGGDEQGVRRERWSTALRFEFLERIPPEPVVHNPMGILVTCLQADRALVTWEER